MNSSETKSADPPPAESKRSSGNDLTQKALMRIRQLMFHNEIVPGQKLAYRDLAKRLNMSPTPVSNALKYLELQGLVRKEHNKGYYTEPVSTEEVREIYDFREVIEVSLLPLAIERLDAEGRTKLRHALERSVNVQNKTYISERVHQDVLFHMTLAELSRARTQVRALRHLFDLLYLKYGGNVLFSQYMPADEFSAHIAGTESCHQQIFDAVVARDAAGAKKAMIHHVRTVKQDVIIGLERMREDKNLSLF